ncbi:GNAT family N-acetyltransferase [Corynebacterium gerontici]|uniref:Putative acyltransferase n=1 Tax=Corynebacterium gerontici TaxID=2079234 RepID=A0A3G6IXX2_9CORY|nr:GNAT family N-acetyltransferase [Corynebacterium gerontici]AZA10621.1 putative acyltransferase [Corynebacterium gerontici]
MQFFCSNIHELTALDLHELYKLRTDVFVVEQDCPYEEIDAIDALKSTIHIRAIEAGQLVGTARVFPRDGMSVIGRFAVHPDFRGTGLAQDLMHQALSLTEGSVWIAAQAALEGYYRQFGFEPCGELFDDAGIMHRPMLRPAAPHAQQ